MKKFLKGRWFPLIAAILLLVLVAIVVLIMIFFGWRFTYAAELKNSWDAISAVAAWGGILVSVVGVAASFIAIWYAIKVPKTIAEQQDKIALFEKRYECYTLIQNFLALSKKIEKLQTTKEIQVAFKIYFGAFENFHNNESASVLAIKLNQQKLIIVSGSFLFPYYNNELLQEIINTSIKLILSVAAETETQAKAALPEKAMQLKQKYCSLCSSFEQNYLNEIESELNLVKNK